MLSLSKDYNKYDTQLYGIVHTDEVLDYIYKNFSNAFFLCEKYLNADYLDVVVSNMVNHNISHYEIERFGKLASSYTGDILNLLSKLPPKQKSKVCRQINRDIFLHVIITDDISKMFKAMTVEDVENNHEFLFLVDSSDLDVSDVLHVFKNIKLPPEDVSFLFYEWKIRDGVVDYFMDNIHSILEAFGDCNNQHIIKLVEQINKHLHHAGRDIVYLDGFVDNNIIMNNPYITNFLTDDVNKKFDDYINKRGMTSRKFANMYKDLNHQYSWTMYEENKMDPEFIRLISLHIHYYKNAVTISDEQEDVINKCGDPDIIACYYCDGVRKKCTNEEALNTLKSNTSRYKQYLERFYNYA